MSDSGLPASGSAPAALDPATVRELRRAQAEYDNPSFIGQLVALYRTNAPSRIDQIRHAVASRDGATLGRVAHTLKSNCSMLGATVMADLCAALEERGDKSAFDGAAALVAALDEQLPRVLAALDDLLENG